MKKPQIVGIGEVVFDIFPDSRKLGGAPADFLHHAVKNGADEIDMVVNIGDVKAGEYDNVLQEIKAVKEACRGKLLKVIIETCLLTEEEKKKQLEAMKKDYEVIYKLSKKHGLTDITIIMNARLQMVISEIAFYIQKAQNFIRAIKDMSNDEKYYDQIDEYLEWKRTKEER